MSVERIYKLKNGTDTAKWAAKRIEQLEKENAELKTELEDTYALYEHGDIYIDGKSLAEHERQVKIETIDRCLDVVGINVTSPIGALIEFREQLKEQE